MADRHVLVKQCLKEIAESKGASVTFMAKFDEAQAGSSSHLHLSLWTNGTNAFASAEQGGAADGQSDEFRWFLGGWIAHASELAAFSAPTVNSYKRFQPQSWAPTALAWSPDNRTAGFRVVGDGASLRIECRIPGADCNPYLAFAAAVASGLDGIEQRIEPPPPFIGDVYAAAELPQVPKTLKEATDLLEGSEFAKRAFGEDVVDALRPLLPHGGRRVPARRHRLGTRALLRTHLKDPPHLIRYRTVRSRRADRVGVTQDELPLIAFATVRARDAQLEVRVLVPAPDLHAPAFDLVGRRDVRADVGGEPLDALEAAVAEARPDEVEHLETADRPATAGPHGFASVTSSADEYSAFVGSGSPLRDRLHRVVLRLDGLFQVHVTSRCRGVPSSERYSCG